MSSTPGGPTPKAGERQPSNAATDGSAEMGKSSQTNPGGTRPLTNAAIDAMLSTAKNASSTTPSTAHTSHPVEPTIRATPQAQATEHPKEPSNANEARAPNADVAIMLQTLPEKVNELTRAKAGTDNHGPESNQGQEEEMANLRNTRRIPAELAAQIQRDLFGDSETPTQRQATPPPNQGQSNSEDADRDKAIKELQATLKDMNSRVHQATSAAPEIDRVLKETQNSPFTTRIYNKPIQHVDALHISNLFIELEEDKEEMAKKYAATRVAATKDKKKEECHESRSRPEAERKKEESDRKALNFHVSDTPRPTRQTWNKWSRDDDSSRYCEFHKRNGHSTMECRHLQEYLLGKY
ncbi:hypothetical protein DY000_02054348 [Brassica cretica]|uniref:Retrotransposon gag domain-containing protein n=1 Tax=Brassica cretica TaxID=69181 RepID=A0ABQ7AGZ9_BRACR|nr:hypothetical protein DY000_02054348 [Brassica cretica]